METISHRASYESNTYMCMKVFLNREPEYHKRVLAAIAHVINYSRTHH
jgi:hypothetical protein